MTSVNFPRYNSIAVTSEDVAALRNIPVDDIVDGMLAFVAGQLARDDGNGGIYRWDETSSEVEDGIDIVAAADTLLGRWKRIISNDAGADNLSAIEAARDATMVLRNEAEAFALAAEAEGDALADNFNAVSGETPRGFYRATPHAVFNWLGIKVRCDRPNAVEVSESIPDYARRVHAGLLGAGAVYVDPVNGLDTNSGSIVAPVKTLSYALRTAAPSQVFLLGSKDRTNPTVFRKSDFRSTDATGNKLKIVTPLGHCTVEEEGPSAESLTWSANATHPSLSEAAPTLVGAVPPAVIEYKARLRRDGQPTRLPYFSDLAALNSAGFGWHWDGTKVVLRIGNVAIADAKADLKITYANSSSRCLIYGSKILFDVGAGSSLVFNGVYLAPLYLSARPYLYARGIEIRNSVAHGIDAQGAYYAVQDSVFFANQGDNLHPAEGGGFSTLAAEINCTSREAGDFDTFGVVVGDTDNGSSMHGSGSVLRWGGLYERNGGPNIVDTGTGKSWNVGVVTRESRATSNDYNFYAVTGSVEMWLDTCHAATSNMGVITAGAGCSIHRFNTTGIGSGAGTIDSYVPTSTP